MVGDCFVIKPEDRLIEDRWYRVRLEDDYCSSRYELIKVIGKYHFIGRLVVHLNDKLIFHLKDNEGSVILPFENIKWMVPFYDAKMIKEKEKDCSWED